VRPHRRRQGRRRRTRSSLWARPISNPAISLAPAAPGEAWSTSGVVAGSGPRHDRLAHRDLPTGAARFHLPSVRWRFWGAAPRRVMLSPHIWRAIRRRRPHQWSHGNDATWYVTSGRCPDRA
jgi:hypothetical protein